MLKPIETQILDGSGVSHRYIGTTMPTGHLIDLLLDLADVTEGPLASLLRGLVGGEVPDEALDAEISLANSGDILKGIKLDGLFARAMARGGARLVRRALVGLKRDSGPEGYIEVGEPSGFDSAYSANLPELFRVLRWVAEVNVFPFSRASGAAGTSP